MTINKHILLLLLWFCMHDSLLAQEKRSWSFEFLPGIAFVPPMPLKIVQDGFDDISMTAHYRTKSLQLPIYYSYRIGSYKNDKGWSLEMNHLKIYLKNTNNEIQQLSVSHGYNQVFINHHILNKKYSWIIGAGAVIGHPESTIRNQTFNEKGGLFNDGYYLSGFALQGAIHYSIIHTKHFNLPIEAKITAGYGKIPISNGDAYIPAIAFHLLMGPQFKW